MFWSQVSIRFSQTAICKVYINSKLRAYTTDTVKPLDRPNRPNAVLVRVYAIHDPMAPPLCERSQWHRGEVPAPPRRRAHPPSGESSPFAVVLLTFRAMSFAASCSDVGWAESGFTMSSAHVWSVGVQLHIQDVNLPTQLSVGRTLPKTFTAKRSRLPRFAVHPSSCVCFGFTIEDPRPSHTYSCSTPDYAFYSSPGCATLLPHPTSKTV